MTAQLGTPQRLPINKLNLYHNNPRQGDTNTIKESLLTHGQFRPIVVNKGTHTGRAYETLAGNHTLIAARQLVHQGHQQFTQLDAYLIDVDNHQATQIMLADNRTADLGTYNNNIILELLDNLDADYTGTGYTQDYIDALLGTNTPETGLPNPNLYTTINLQLNPQLNKKWQQHSQKYETPEKALEHLLDKHNKNNNPKNQIP